MRAILKSPEQLKEEQEIIKQLQFENDKLIKEILMTADHEKINELMKQEREARKKKRLSKIKNDEKWDEIKEDHDKKLQELS